MAALTPDRQALKRATRALVRAVGGQEAAVGFTRLKRHQAFSDFASCAPDHAERFMPADIIADLEGVTAGTPGHPAVTRELARQAGFALVPLPRARGGGRPMADHLAEVIRESAEVTMTLALDLRAPAGVLRERLRREVAEAVQALIDLDAALAADEGGAA